MQIFKLMVIFALGLSLGVWLLPSKNEQIAMLMMDKQYHKAFEALTRLYGEGDRQPQTLRRLYKLHELYGNEEMMQQILIVYREEHPGDIFMQKKLADLYFRTNQSDAYLKLLEDFIDKSPNAEYAQKLLARLVLGGDFEEEKRLLKKFQFLPFFSASNAARLGLIELNLGNQDKALALFRRMEQLGRDEKKHFEARLSLFRLLVQMGLVEEAYRGALLWVHFETHDGNLLVMTRQLRVRGYMDLAIGLAMKARKHRSAATFVLVELLVSQKRFGEARFWLGDWRQAEHKPSSQDLTRYIKSQLAAKNLPVVIGELHELGIAQIPPEALIALGEELVWQKQQALLRQIRPFFTFEALSRRPLFAAQIFMAQGKRQLARHFLNKTGPRNISKDRNLMWFTLYKDIHGKQGTFEMARSMMENKKLPRNLLKEYAKLAQALGLMSEYELAWVELGGVPANAGQETDQGVGL